MRLISFSLSGYRRFVEKTSVKLHGDLIAFVGPNEAGKSSLLRAMARLHVDNDFETTELPRRSSAKPELSWQFQLEAEDGAALAGIPDTDGLQRLTITKRSGHEAATWTFKPHNPRRDRTARDLLAVTLAEGRGDPAVTLAGEEQNLDLDRYDSLTERLAARSDLAPEDISRLRALAEELAELARPEPAHEDDAVGEAAMNSEWFDRQDALVAAIQNVAEQAEQPDPWRQAVDALTPRLPPIKLFTEADRDLASEYELEDVAEAPPSALRHLAKLAGLDLVALRDEAVAGSVADVGTRRNAANRRLLAAFDEGWNQQGIALALDVQGTVLHVLATTPEDTGLSRISERSDGLRWFAALLAYSHGWTSAPILLVDELETHLHYDAQADLISVLAKQAFTSKVIYTTHSIGCLPYDLGTGVRVVQPVDAATSRLVNGFWNSGAGFSPLMVSMGAAAMSFTPTRRAVLAEGAADAILLPTLFRQAVGVPRLEYQIAPGLASVAPSEVADLDAEAGRVAFLVDGDPAGEAIQQKLETAGVDSSRIIRVQASDGSAMETEDLLDAHVYADAVNAELALWNEMSEEISSADVASLLRTSAVAAWCQAHGVPAPDKVAVAQRAVDASVDRPIFATEHVELIRELHHRVSQLLLT